MGLYPASCGRALIHRPRGASIPASLAWVRACVCVLGLQRIPPLSTSTTAVINVLDVNEYPVLSYTRIILDENSPVDTLVGYPILVRDQDVDKPGSTQIVRFSMGLLANGSVPPFLIDSVTGQIQVSDNVLNFEVVPLYNLTVIATDDGTPPLSSNVTVTVALRYVAASTLQ